MIKKIATVSALALTLAFTASVALADTHASSTRPQFTRHHESELENASTTEREMNEHATSTASSTALHLNLGKHLGQMKNHASSTALSHGDLKKNFHAHHKGKNGHKHATFTSDR